MVYNFAKALTYVWKLHSQNENSIGQIQKQRLKWSPSDKIIPNQLIAEDSAEVITLYLNIS